MRMGHKSKLCNLLHENDETLNKSEKIPNNCEIYHVKIVRLYDYYDYCGELCPAFN